MQITFFAHSGIIRATSDLIKWATQDRTLLIPPYANVLDGLVFVYFSTCWGSSCMVPQCCLFNHTRNLHANQKDSGQKGSDSATDDPANLHMRSPTIGGYYILWLWCLAALFPNATGGYLTLGKEINLFKSIEMESSWIKYWQRIIEWIKTRVFLDTSEGAK